MDTLTTVRAQLDAHRGDWPAICRATDLRYDWLCKFAQGRIADPSSTKIARLSAHLDSLDAERDTNDKAA